ncbi:undecaprenyldiphospho-muramoylpentapeptide beta-N-acetylglucosaminyltransferase [Aquifex pyrophilus]
MIAVSGGGTGGHFFPALAFIEYAKKKENILFIGAKRGIEYRLREIIGVPSLFFEIYPFRGVRLKERLRALYGVLKAQRELYKKLKGDFSSLVFGGYASLPLGIHTILRRKKLFIHEQNSVPSRTNKLLSRKAEGIFITFEHTRKYFKDALKTGIPLREKVKKRYKDAKRKLGLNPEKKTLLIFGGSQGALFLNELTERLIDLLPEEVQVILISGEKHYERFKDLKGVKVLPFSLDMALIYSASDLAITRAGAGTITELSYHGIPSLFIPYPYAADDHQFFNAKEIEEIGGGLVIRQEEANEKVVLKLLERILSDYERFKKGIKGFYKEGAEKKILDVLTG